MKVYLDMDGVLVDLWGGYEELTGISLIEADKKYGSLSHEVWSPTLEVDDFWFNLSKDSGADVLLEYMQENYPVEKTFILSAPIRLNRDSCIEQKRRWATHHTHLLEEHIHIVPRSQKVDFAWCDENDIPNILVDDYIKNIKEWESQGGIGIHHTDVDTTLQKLHDLLRGNKNA